MRERTGHALRTSHAKAHGHLRGELRVDENLPPELRQGLFAESRSYPVAVRLAQVLGEVWTTAASRPRAEWRSR